MSRVDDGNTKTSDDDLTPMKANHLLNIYIRLSVSSINNLFLKTIPPLLFLYSFHLLFFRFKDDRGW